VSSQLVKNWVSLT